MLRCARMLYLALVAITLPLGVLRAQDSVPANVITYRLDSSTADGPGLRFRTPVPIRPTSRCDFTTISAIAARSDGSTVIGDYQTRQVCVYDRAGRFQFRLGSGDNDGVTAIGGIFVLAGDSIVVYEGLRGTLLFYDPRGRRVRTVVITPPDTAAGSITTVHPQTDGTFLVGFAEFRRADPRRDAVYVRHRLVRVDANGQIVARLGSFPFSEHFFQAVPGSMGGTAYWDLAFGRRFRMAAAGDGFYGGDGSSFELREYDSSGAVRTVRRVDEPRRAITPAVIDAWVHSNRPRQSLIPDSVYRRLDAEMPYPAEAPAYRNVVADSAGLIWMERYPLPDDTVTSLVVLDPVTRRATPVTLPMRFASFAISQGFICGVVRRRPGVDDVMCYPLRRPARGQMP